jgi:hypothetical protein
MIQIFTGWKSHRRWTHVSTTLIVEWRVGAVAVQVKRSKISFSQAGPDLDDGLIDNAPDLDVCYMCESTIREELCTVGPF